MSGRLDQQAREIAFALAHGGLAELTKLDTSRGRAIHAAWVDDLPVILATPRPKRAPAVRVTVQGETFLYLATSEQQARDLYQRALQLVEEMPL